MSDKVAKLSPPQVETTGDRLARTAEGGSLDAFNKELSQIRASSSKGDYLSVVDSVKRNNSGHVQEDQRQVKDYNANKWFFQSKAENHVPTLIIEDKSKDKSHPDYRAVGYIVADSPRAATVPGGTASTSSGGITDTSSGGTAGSDRTKAAARGLNSDSIPFFAAFNEDVALAEADKVSGGDRPSSAPAKIPAK